jgi:hypothetical protein
MEQQAYYLVEAQLAATEAQKATTPEMRERWLAIAEDWRRMVDASPKSISGRPSFEVGSFL